MHLSSPTSSSDGRITGTPHFFRPTYLMCPPEFYDVRYVINPWMAGNLHRPTRDRAFTQWRGLYETLRRHADVRILSPEPNCPDMTFVAHSAVVQHGVVALSSFAHAERRAEQRPLQRWFEEAGFLLWQTPRETAFEGEGDTAFDESGNALWMARGPRTCEQSHAHVASAWHLPVHSLQLIDPRFYHLDTCFAPLSGGHLLWFPEAFDEESVQLIERSYPAEYRIAVSEREATQFACNVINIGKVVLMNQVSGPLPAKLSALGFRVEQLAMTEFVQGGGSVKSLALRLSDCATGVLRKAS